MDIERLRALEKKWRAAGDAETKRADGDGLSDGEQGWHHGRGEQYDNCADELATLIAELGQEVVPVAWPSERVSIADPHDPGYRIVGFKISESHPWHGKYGLSEPLNALDRAISNSPAHTSEARDASVMKLLDERIAAETNKTRRWALICFRDAAMRQEGGNG